MNTFSNAFFLSCIIGFAYFALIETRLHRVEAKDYENSLNKKFTTFAGELKKLLDHQNVISSAQTHILEKLSGLESNTVSSSGLSEDEGISPQSTPCPPAGGISSLELESKLINLNQNIQGILSRLNAMENPIRPFFQKQMKLVGTSKN